MSFLSGLFKNQFEKLFGVSQLRVDKDPYYAEPKSQTVRFRFKGVY